MNVLRLIVVPIFFFSDLYAQNIDISGRVLNRSAVPVQNAMVSLQKTGLRDTTDSQGLFEISNPLTGVHADHPRQGAPCYGIRRNRSDGPIRSFALTGKVLSTENAASSWRLLAQKGLPPSVEISLVSRRCFKPGVRHTGKQGNGAALISESAAGPEIDTLLVAHPDFVLKKLPLDNYVKEEGDILLDSFPHWRDPAVLSIPGCGNPAIFCASSGTVYLFYTSAANGGVRMMMRTKVAGSPTFGNEFPVYTGAKTVSFFQGNADTVYVAVETASIVAVLGTRSAGEQWWQEVSYPCANSSLTPAWYPVSLTGKQGQLVLAYGYSYNTGVYGARQDLYLARKTSAGWETTPRLIGRGPVCHAILRTDSLAVMTGNGVYISTNGGENFSLNGGSETIPEMLRASDACGSFTARSFMTRAYTYGPEPLSKHLSVTWSNDGGFSWLQSQKIIATSTDYFYSPHIAADSGSVLVVWRKAGMGGAVDSLLSIFSLDNGPTWSGTIPCAGMKAGELLLPDQMTLAASRNGFACAYAVGDGNSGKEIRVAEFR